MGRVKDSLDENGYFDPVEEGKFLADRDAEDARMLQESIEEDTNSKHKDIFDLIDDIQEKAQLLKKLVDEL